MNDFMAALNDFFNGFDVEAFIADGVPDGAALPCITYECALPAAFAEAALRARVWFRPQRRDAGAALCRRLRDALTGGAPVGEYVLTLASARAIPNPDPRVLGVELSLRVV